MATIRKAIILQLQFLQFDAAQLESAPSSPHPRHAAWVTVDTEGYDAMVIEGMSKALEHRRIAVLEFEYHGVGAWGGKNVERRTLKATLEKLHRLSYKCYFATFSSLLPASGACWQAAFEFNDWSNLVCAHEPEALAVLDRVAMDGWRQRKLKCTTATSPYLPTSWKGAVGDARVDPVEKAALAASFIAGNGTRKQNMRWDQHCPRAPAPYNPHDFTRLAGLYY